MGGGNRFLKQLAEDANRTSGQSLVEIAGDYRVLIENHFGIVSYSREQILVRVKYGCLCVCGCELEILRMTREQLVICGKIHGLRIQRKGQS